jgi:hypothetical protein
MGPVSVFLDLLLTRLLKFLHHREGQGFILVYSVTSRRTFERLDLFFQSMRRVKRAQPVFMLVGNKIDQSTRQVSFQEGKSAADRFGCEFVETSAKTAYQVDRAFTDLVRTLRRQRGADGSLPMSITPPPNPTPYSTLATRCSFVAPSLLVVRPLLNPEKRAAHVEKLLHLYLLFSCTLLPLALSVYTLDDLDRIA